MRVVWRAAARDDRRRITAWLSDRNLSAAIRVARALVEASDSLAVLPNKGRPGRLPGTRELSSVPPYVIIYEVDQSGEVVRILRV